MYEESKRRTNQRITRRIDLFIQFKSKEEIKEREEAKQGEEVEEVPGGVPM